MPPNPWWIDRVAALLAPTDLTSLDLGALFRLGEGLQFIRQNVDPALLGLDLAAVPASASSWAAFGQREAAVGVALALAGSLVAGRVRGGTFGPAAFRAHWEGLGFARHLDDAGSAADDFLDGVFHVSRLDVDLPAPPFANLNLASRAERVADFLAVTRPGAADVVFDLGSGSGKLALTVAASSAATLRGVELVSEYVSQSNRSAAFLGLGNVDFVQADARDVDLSGGSIFYLYFPFRGPVAQAVAEALGRVARQRPITIYASGPTRDFGEHLLAQVARGALVLSERRGEFEDVLVLRSAGA